MCVCVLFLSIFVIFVVFVVVVVVVCFSFCSSSFFLFVVVVVSLIFSRQHSRHTVSVEICRNVEQRAMTTKQIIRKHKTGENRRHSHQHVQHVELQPSQTKNTKRKT